MEFICHVCVFDNEDAPEQKIPYRLTGAGDRTSAKVMWPLLLIPIRLANLKSPALDLTELACEFEYSGNDKNVCVFSSTYLEGSHDIKIQCHVYPMELRGGAAGNIQGSQDSHNFLLAARELEMPGNTIVLLDSHSDPYTGDLQVSKKPGGFDGISDLLNNCIGEAVTREMLHASSMAQGWKREVRLKSGKKPWADLSPRVRGGWRVLIILACGSTVTVRDAWVKLKDLIEQ